MAGLNRLLPSPPYSCWPPQWQKRAHHHHGHHGPSGGKSAPSARQSAARCHPAQSGAGRPRAQHGLLRTAARRRWPGSEPHRRAMQRACSSAPGSSAQHPQHHLAHAFGLARKGEDIIAVDRREWRPWPPVRRDAPAAARAIAASIAARWRRRLGAAAGAAPALPWRRLVRLLRAAARAIAASIAARFGVVAGAAAGAAASALAAVCSALRGSGAAIAASIAGAFGVVVWRSSGPGDAPPGGRLVGFAGGGAGHGCFDGGVFGVSRWRRSGRGVAGGSGSAPGSRGGGVRDRCLQWPRVCRRRPRWAGGGLCRRLGC